MSNFVNYLSYIKKILELRFNNNLKQAASEFKVTEEHLNNVLHYLELPNINLIKALSLYPYFQYEVNCCTCKFSLIKGKLGNIGENLTLECNYPNRTNKGEHLDSDYVMYFDEYEKVAQECKLYKLLTEEII